MITEIWYSIQNGGDGSYYPKLMESEELCKIDQEYLDESFGEPCIGCIEIESDSPITIKDKIATIDTEILEIEKELNADYMIKYKKEGKYPEWFERLEGKLKALKKLKGE